MTMTPSEKIEDGFKNFLTGLGIVFLIVLICIGGYYLIVFLLNHPFLVVGISVLCLIYEIGKKVRGN